jgi:hypothetical protein
MLNITETDHPSCVLLMASLLFAMPAGDGVLAV